ncbi:MAG TPA: hypothetical protein VD905_20705 [Flavobacteriales bacterium]|nr:hypothetical protein [Flavobacteriales bacterium]
MKYVLCTTIAIYLVGCGNSGKKETAWERKSEVPVAQKTLPVEEESPVELTTGSGENASAVIKTIPKPVKLPVFKTKIRVVSIPADLKQQFAIVPIRDTVLKAKNGTSIKIPANAFVDVNGKPVEGPVNVEVFEALETTDILFANLSTTSNGEILQTGGMINITASCRNEPVQLASEKSLDVTMPTDAHKQGMSLYYGKEESSCVNWVDPVLLDPAENKKDRGFVRQRSVIATTSNETDFNGFTIWDINDENKKANYNAVHKELSEMAFGKNKVKITNDSTFFYKGYKTTIWKQKPGMIWGPAVKGQNTFQIDTSTCYVFNIKKLGWANIDRLYHDPRSKDVNMVTKVENENEFGNIVITLVFSKEGLYLPGYQKTDETFSFSHGDYENQRLPVGAKATVVALAYKDNVPYYDIKTFSISERLENKLNLKQGTAEGLKTELAKEI